MAAVNGDREDDIIHMEVSPGQKLTLDASDSTDPDGDTLTFRWWVYQEAGTYPGNVEVSDPSEKKARVTVPDDARGREIHVILEVVDENPEIGMFDYRRVVLKVL
jgi:hypothetical protein